MADKRANRGRYLMTERDTWKDKLLLSQVTFPSKSGVYQRNLPQSAAPDSNVPEANMRPIRSRQDPGGPHVGPLNFTIWGVTWAMDVCL